MRSGGKNLMLVCSVLLLFYGSASILAIALSLLQPNAETEKYALAQHLKMGLPAISVTVLVIKVLLQFGAGFFGVRVRDWSKSSRTALWLGTLCLLFGVADTVLCLVSGVVPDASEITAYAIEILLLALYLVGTKLCGGPGKAQE